MKKRFGLLLGLILISMLLVVSISTGNAGQCDTCHGVAVEKSEAITEQEKFQPVVVASVHLAKHVGPAASQSTSGSIITTRAQTFDDHLVSNLSEITEKQEPITFGKTAHLIKPYVPNAAEMKWLQVLNLKVRKSQNTHCPCPWRNDPLSEFELHEANGTPVLTADFR